MSLKELILKCSEPKPAREPVTIGGNSVYVYEMTGLERDAYEAAQVEANKAGTGMHNFRARLLVRTLVDENYVRIFDDADADALGKLPAREIRKPFDIAAKLNALTPDDEKELAKNS